MKVGLLSYRSHPYSGGQGIYIKHLSKALKNLGHEVSVLSGPPYPELDSGVNLIKIPSLGLFESGDRLKAFRLRFLWSPIDLYEWITVMTGGFPEPYTYGKRVLKRLKENNLKLDVLLDNQSLSSSLLEIQAHYPLAVTIHHPITKDHKLEMQNAINWKERLSSSRWHNFLPMQKKVAPQLKNIICVSQPSKEDVISEFKVDEKKITVIPNGIDIGIFKPSSIKKSFSFRIVTTASADIPLKGLRHLILALPRVMRQFPLTSLTVIGKSPDKSNLNNLIDDLDLEDKITFRSGISEKEIVKTYHDSDIAVIPSLYEGFGFGAGEAMACGVPLISTDSGGLKQVIGDAALKIKPGSVSEIEEGILKLFTEEKIRQELAEKGRERMEEFFDWKIAASAYIEVFKKII
ncbi:glycosyltransferase family 4 protein [SAR86 cluster bacterium]|nr:glycosyltransferase family 4 protein [SAR86 cluster bacterium]